MKSLIALSLTLIALNASAENLECPRGNTQVVKCVKAPKKSDHYLALAVMDEALVCKDAKGVMRLGLALDGAVLGNSKVKVLPTVGAINYSFLTDGVKFSLNTSGKSGSFTMYYPGDISASRELSCSK